jgi:ATP-dependent DNA helicase RecG
LPPLLLLLKTLKNKMGYNYINRLNMNKPNILDLIKLGEGVSLEFKESYTDKIGKSICAFANASGGKIILGVKDNGQIKGFTLNNATSSKIQDIARAIDPSITVDIKAIDNIVIIKIPEGMDKPYFINGRCYLRIGSNSQQLNRAEIEEFLQDEGRVTFDKKYYPFDFKDFSKKAYLNFLSKVGIKTNLKQEQLLTNLEFLKSNKLNGAGVLLFSKDIRRYLPNAVVQCVLYKGTSSDIIDKKEFNEDLISNFENTIAYIKSKLNTEYVIKSIVRKEYLEIPEDALREALINSFAHRDYFSSAPIIVNIYIDRLEIINPFIYNSKITLNDLLKGSYPKNPFLFGFLERMDFVEKAGSGFTRIRKALKEYKLPMVKIEFSKVLFILTFKRPNLQINSYQTRVLGLDTEKERETTQTAVEKTVEKTVEKIILEITKNPKITQNELIKLTGLTRRGIEWNLQKLKARGIIKRVGPDKGGHWQVIKK